VVAGRQRLSTNEFTIELVVARNILLINLNHSLLDFGLVLGRSYTKALELVTRRERKKKKERRNGFDGSVVIWVYPGLVSLITAVATTSTHPK